LPIYGPLFLQHLHGLTPLAAGYMIAGMSLAWTLGALAVASLPDRWSARMIVVGPLAMAGGLLGTAALMPAGPIAALFLPIALMGTGIGVCWAFVAHRVMSSARPGEENTAAAAVPTIHQVGMAFGAAAAGLVANASGLAGSLALDDVLRAALWVPASFVAAALLACLTGLHLNTLARQDKQV
jgi:predicted MFS family arabinose efflux permease